MGFNSGFKGLIAIITCVVQWPVTVNTELGRMLKNRSSPVETQHPSICRAGGNTQIPLLGKSIFEPTYDTGSCWLRISKTKLSTHSFHSKLSFPSHCFLQNAKVDVSE